MAVHPIPSAKAPSDNLFSRGMLALLVAQFISALADNALLFAAIALLKSQAAPNWQMPLLQEFFAIAFISLAPFVGPFADHWPKGRVLLVSNTIKLAGVAAMLTGLHPLLAYGLVGIGAAAYSPAKYGILSELVSAQMLVKANGMIEGSTIVAILLGAVLGGWLADISVHGALLVIGGCYIVAAIANLLIPRLPPAHRMAHFTPRLLTRDFFDAFRSLFRNPDARFAIIGTSIFWSAGSTLRFLLIAWVPVALSISDNSTPANLSGVVAIGIALGAAAAARFVNLESVNRALYAGLLIGILIMLFSITGTLAAAGIMLILIGACGGFYVVPLNALLQERGHETVGSGHAIAIQNFFENCCMISVVGLYALMAKSGLPVIFMVVIFGGLIVAAIGTLSWFRLYRLPGKTPAI
ncbi:MAG TPA: lysophospholipid transporter LplT [Methylophilaceae bacterium]|nr:lysophospholipid transporter LplT [Methylophilaceae bacterium]